MERNLKKKPNLNCAEQEEQEEDGNIVYTNI